MTIHHFVGPLVPSILDFGWLCPWVLWMHHHLKSLVCNDPQSQGHELATSRNPSHFSLLFYLIFYLYLKNNRNPYCDTEIHTVMHNITTGNSIVQDRRSNYFSVAGTLFFTSKCCSQVVLQPLPYKACFMRYIHKPKPVFPYSLILYYWLQSFSNRRKSSSKMSRTFPK